MSHLFKLRPYQDQGKEAIKAEFKKGKKRVIFCSPTGSGKTVTFANIARESVLNGFKVLIIVDRKELLQQAREKLIDYGLNPSLITAGRQGKTGASSYIATVQTLARRSMPDVNLIIVDEAHKQIFDKILEKPEYANAFIIGATATPYRTGKMTQLSQNYNALVDTLSINDLIRGGYLVPAITYGAAVDTSKIKVKRGDYDNQELYKAFDKAVLYSGVVEKYRKFANNTKTICFCINVEHSKKVTDAFNAAGIPAVHLDGTTPKKQRESILEAFKNGSFKVLCNVEVLTTGFDEWTIETVIVNLATKSLPKWLQMAGRGSRITPHQLQGQPGHLQKEHFNLIDMGGNVFKLGFWEAERKYSLSHKTKDTIDAAPVKTCKACEAIVPAPAPVCKYCGFVFPKVEKKAPDVEFIQLENYEHLPPELRGKGWSEMSLKELEAVRKIKGYKLGWIVNQIRNNNLNLIDYAVMRNFKNPSGWVWRTNQTYFKQ